MKKVYFPIKRIQALNLLHLLKRRVKHFLLLKRKSKTRLWTVKKKEEKNEFTEQNAKKFRSTARNNTRKDINLQLWCTVVKAAPHRMVGKLHGEIICSQEDITG